MLNQGFDDFVQISLDNGVEAVQCQAYPVIRHPVLREVVGADFFTPVACSNHGFSVRGDFVLLLPQRSFIEAGSQDLQGFCLVFNLGFFILAGNYFPCWQVSNSNSRVGGIDRLATRGLRNSKCQS